MNAMSGGALTSGGGGALTGAKPFAGAFAEGFCLNQWGGGFLTGVDALSWQRSGSGREHGCVGIGGGGTLKGICVAGSGATPRPLARAAGGVLYPPPMGAAGALRTELVFDGTAASGTRIGSDEDCEAVAGCSALRMVSGNICVDAASC